MECLDSTQENIEKALGEALTARSIALDYYTGLGPPDLCCLDKVYLRAWLPPDPATVPPTGYYHWVVGVECSCPAAVSAYFDSLLRAQAKASWYASGEYKVVKATFAVYNALKRVDVRCEAKFPGKVRTYMVDGKGSCTEDVPNQVWEEAYLCSMLRSQQPLASLPSIKFLPRNPMAFDDIFITLADRYFWQGSKLGNRPDERSDGDHANHLTATLADYFAANFRPDNAVSFFSRFIDREPCLSVHVAKALMRMGKAARAEEILKMSIGKNPNSSALHVAMSNVFLSQGKFGEAISAGESAVACEQTSAKAWIALAKAYVGMQAYDMALVMLNGATLAPLKHTPIIGVPKPYQTTKPPSLLAEAWSMPLTSLDQEDQDEPLLDLGGRPKPEQLPSEEFRGDWREAFDVLVEVMNCVGWDDMLEIRARVFLMKDDVSSNKHSDGAAKAHASSGSEHQHENEGEVAGQNGLDTGRKQQDSEELQNAGVVGDEDSVSDEGTSAGGGGAAAAARGGGGGGDRGEARGLEEEVPEIQEGSPRQVTVGGVAFGHSGGAGEGGESGGADEGGEQDEGGEGGEGSGKADGGGQEDAGRRHGDGASECGESVLKEAGAKAEGEGEREAQSEEGRDARVKEDQNGQRGMRKLSEMKKRVCRPWLDSVFHGLYEDLKAYFAWLSEEEKWAKEDLDDVSDDELDERMLTSGEWVHRAEIAKRLQNLSDAERAYRSAAFVGTCPKAWAGLLKMYSSEGCQKETLLAAHELLDCFEAYKANPPPPAPLQVREAVFELVSMHGLQKVRDAQDSIGVPHPIINELFHHVVRCQVQGFSN